MSWNQGTNFAHGHGTNGENSQLNEQKDNQLNEHKDTITNAVTEKDFGEQSSRNNSTSNLLSMNTSTDGREKIEKPEPPSMNSTTLQDVHVISNQRTPQPANIEGSVNRAYGTFVARRPAQYEELFGGTMACPTCQGSGRIPRDSADEMVALIPIRDKRLRPRRTCLYVSIAVFICVAIAGLLLYFLLPRNIRLESKHGRLRPYVRIVNITEQYVFLSLWDQYNITNDNYFPVDVTDFEVTTSFDQKAQLPVKNQTKIMIPMRSRITYFIQVNLTFEQSEGYIAYYCSKGIPGSHSLLIPFVATLTTSYLGHQEETTLQSYKLVQCGPEKMWQPVQGKTRILTDSNTSPSLYNIDNR